MSTVTRLLVTRLLVAVGLLAAALVTTPATAASPNLSSYPNADASYPRAIRLDHDGNAGRTVLATFARRNESGPNAFPIFRSTRHRRNRHTHHRPRVRRGAGQRRTGSGRRRVPSSPADPHRSSAPGRSRRPGAHVARAE